MTIRRLTLLLVAEASRRRWDEACGRAVADMWQIVGWASWKGYGKTRLMTEYLERYHDWRGGRFKRVNPNYYRWVPR